MSFDYGCLPIMISPLSKSLNKKSGSDSLIVSLSQVKYYFHNDILFGFFARASWNLRKKVITF